MERDTPPLKLERIDRIDLRHGYNRDVACLWKWVEPSRVPAEEEKKEKKERKRERRKRERVIEFDASQRYRSVAEIFLHTRENYFESKVKRRGWRIFFFWEKQLDRMESLTRFRWFSRFEVKIKKNINEQLEIWIVDLH